MAKVAKIKIHGKLHELSYEEGESLLETALRADINPPYSCMEGVCCACLAKVIQGQVDHREDSILDPEELKEGKILTCQSRMQADCQELVISYDDL